MSQKRPSAYPTKRDKKPNLEAFRSRHLDESLKRNASKFDFLSNFAIAKEWLTSKVIEYDRVGRKTTILGKAVAEVRFTCRSLHRMATLCVYVAIPTITCNMLTRKIINAKRQAFKRTNSKYLKYS